MIHIGVLPREEAGVSAADVEAWMRVQRRIAQRQAMPPSGERAVPRGGDMMMSIRPA